MFFPDAGPGDADTVIARVREKIKTLATKRGAPVAVGCNFGVAYAQAPPDSPDELLRAADHDMLRRKR